MRRPCQAAPNTWNAKVPRLNPPNPPRRNFLPFSDTTGPPCLGTDTLILPLPKITAPPSLSPTAPDGQALLSHPPAPTHSTPQPRPWLGPQPPGLDDCRSQRTKEPVALPLASLCSNPSYTPRRRDFLNSFLTCPGWVVFPHSLRALPTPEVRCWVDRGCRSFAASCPESTSG